MVLPALRAHTHSVPYWTRHRGQLAPGNAGSVVLMHCPVDTATRRARNRYPINQHTHTPSYNRVLMLAHLGADVVKAVLQHTSDQRLNGS